MRMHISLPDELIDELDRRVGPRGRSSFIARAVRNELEHERRWESLESAAGSLADHDHEWDRDPARWVREQRRLDSRRTG